MLQKAKNNIEDDKKINIVIDEATRNTTGSENIIFEIIRKINIANIFVCDISTINKTDSNQNRKTPNPNVMYELGYAVAKLGWKRIILILNEEYGSIKDVPFDIQQHIITKYKISETNATNIKSVVGTKAKELETKIQNILDIEPEKENLNNDETIRQRDINIIEKIMGQVPYTLIREQIRIAPDKILIDLPNFFDDFEHILHNNIEYLHDNEMSELFRDLHSCWLEILQSTCNYHQNNPKSQYAVFDVPLGDMPLSDEQDEIWNIIKKLHQDIDHILTKILDIIKAKYIEIDLKKINDDLIQTYIKIKKEIDEQWKN